MYYYDYPKKENIERNKMKFEVLEPNYAAQVVKVNRLLDLEGADRLHGIPLFGMQALTSKGGVNIGDLGILFPTECQLSEDFAFKNNLYSSQLANEDTNVKGYLPANRRVRAIKLRGHNSNCLFMTMKSLEVLGINTSNLKEGDAFNSIDGVEICRKYVIKETQALNPKNPKNRQLRKSRIESKLMPEHIDTDNWWRNEHKISEDTEIIVTAKYHGTSVRLANQICDRKLSKFEKLLKWFGIKIQTTEYDYFAGSRRVIKDYKRLDYETLDHYYTVDIYNAALAKVKQSIPKGYVVYAELVGWSGESPIQRKYTYCVPKKEFDTYVYRIAQINPDGLMVDLSWDQVKQACASWGIKHVPELWRGKKKDFNVDFYMDKKFVIDLGLTECLNLDSDAPCDEGVVIRVEGLVPYLLKAKAPLFLGHESEVLDLNMVVVD
jgi:hypothetical protein